MKLFLLLAVALLPVSTLGQRIDFESLPDGNAVRGGLVISNQFAVPPYGVTFQFEDGSYPYIRTVGAANSSGRPTAFFGVNGVPNQPRDGQDVGARFISDSADVDAAPAPLIITYVQPVSAASGFILDIDHAEAWRIEARNQAGQVLAEVQLRAGTSTTGNGIATPWSFRLPTAEIRSIRIAYTGDTSGAVGLAFDNFSPANGFPTPTPAKIGTAFDTNRLSFTVVGTPFAVYRIQESPRANNPEWTELTSVVLSAPSLTLTNLIKTTETKKFYRAVAVE